MINNILKTLSHDDMLDAIRKGSCDAVYKAISANPLCFEAFDNAIIKGTKQAIIDIENSKTYCNKV